jgi:hypothetical protein
MAQSAAGRKIDVRHVKYPVVRDAIEQIGIETTDGDRSARIVWWDGFMPNPDFFSIYPYQRINKIPGMDVMCYKTTFCQALVRMKAMFPSYYNFFPASFVMPHQFADFQREHLRLVGKGYAVTWIIKPKCGCCGNGIKIIQSSFEIPAQNQSSLIQRYVSPYLLDGFKFDFRFYILVAALQPFTFYIYNEGLARFCTHEYSGAYRHNLDDRFCHLTNTAVNVTNAEKSNAILELASTVLKRIAASDPRGVSLWTRIKHISLLSMIAQSQNILRNIGLLSPDPHRDFEYSRHVSNPDPPGPNLEDLQRYFHVLGIDILLNESCDPIVLELNDRPSMCATFDIEGPLKTQVVRDALNLVTLDGSEPDARANAGGWEKLFPDEATPFGRVAGEILSRACIGTGMSPKRMIMKRLGYIPSASNLHRTYYKSGVLPPLHQ